MVKYSTKYSSEWEKTYNWLQRCPSDTSSAKCKICNCTFKVNGSGISQVKSHASSKKHSSAQNILSGNSSQTTFLADNNTGTCQLSKGKNRINEPCTVNSLDMF